MNWWNLLYFEKSLLCRDDHNVATNDPNVATYKVVHTQYFQSTFFFQRLHKLPSLHVSKKAWTVLGEHDQQSLLLK